MQVVVDGDESAAFAVRIGVDCAEQFDVVEYAGPGHDGAHPAGAEPQPEPKVLAITRDLAQELASATQGQVVAPQLVDFAEFLKDRLILDKKVAVTGAECAELAAVAKDAQTSSDVQFFATFPAWLLGAAGHT